MEATAAGCVILNAVKDLIWALDKILHYVQDDRYFHFDDRTEIVI